MPRSCTNLHFIQTVGTSRMYSDECHSKCQEAWQLPVPCCSSTGWLFLWQELCCKGIGHAGKPSGNENLFNWYCSWLICCKMTLHTVHTPWSRAFEKLTDSQLVKKFPTFYGTWRFITAFTSSCHLSLSWARSIQFMLPIPLPEDPSEYYLPIYAWVFQLASIPQVSPPKPCMHLSSPQYMLHAQPISLLFLNETVVKMLCVDAISNTRGLS